MTRAFTAIPVPEEEAKKLSEIQDSIGVGMPVRPEKMHITFEFFKNLDETEVEEIRSHLKSLEADPFKVKLEGLGVFPSKQYIRVLWTGVNSGNIHDLYRKASSHSVESDNDHKFNPHVTLSRIKDVRRGDKKRIHEKLSEFDNKFIGEFEASRIIFYESQMGSDGTNYREICVKEL